ncbi:hypothetical protein BYT27DRAFT_7228279 [Phlegmacium glaucopus]|nr:hypothetical protein BYT27DRAFT_7228279 [Phlegmacium glaucopus]
MDPPEESTALSHCSSLPLTYPPPFLPSSLTSRHLSSLLSSALYGKDSPPSHAPSSTLPLPTKDSSLTRDRLRLWLPLAPRNTLDLEGNPTNLETIAGAWADATRETYGSGLLVFHVYCDKKMIAEEQRAPASPVLIASFISTLSSIYSGSAISNYVFGIRAWHLLHGIPWRMNLAEIEALLKSADKSSPASSKRKKRQPYTIDFMLSIKDNLDLSQPLHVAVFACLTTTFYTAARDFHSGKHVTLSSVQIKSDRNNLISTMFALPVTKAEPILGEEVSWSRQHGGTDPKAALGHHLTTNAPPQNFHLFAYRAGDTHKLLTKSKFIKTLATAAKAAGLDPRQGHGIRIGSTLEFLLRGTPFDVMKVKGRWASDAFLAYLRKYVQILAPYTYMQAHPLQHDEFTRITMPPIQR